MTETTATTEPLFDNCREFLVWYFRNCDRCRKQYDEAAGVHLCDLEEAIDEAQLLDGTVPPAIGQRLGVTDGGPARRCPEFEEAAS